MEWIKAKDRIPEHTDELILYYDGTVFCAWFDGKKKYFVIDNDGTIVYPDTTISIKNGVRDTSIIYKVYEKKNN